jgi:hypothetical protein
MIDYSLAKNKLQVELEEDEDPSEHQRPFDKLIKAIKQKLDLKLNIYGEPETILEQIITDVENAKTTKNLYLRETLLDKVLKELIDYEEPEFEPDLTKNLVQEEIDKEEMDFKLNLRKETKIRVLLAAEVAELAFEENLIELAQAAAKECCVNEWDVHKDIDLVIAQSKGHYVLAQCSVEHLLDEEVEIGYEKLITIDEDQDDRDFSREDEVRFKNLKLSFVNHIRDGV